MVKPKAILEIDFEIIGRGKMKKTLQKEQKLAFLGIGKKDGRNVAFMVNVNTVGDPGLSSLRSAWLTHASPLSRKGIFPVTEDGLKDRINVFEKMGQVDNRKVFETALQTLNNKNGITQSHVASAPKHAM